MGARTVDVYFGVPFRCRKLEVGGKRSKVRGAGCERLRKEHRNGKVYTNRWGGDETVGEVDKFSAYRNIRDSGVIFCGLSPAAICAMASGRRCGFEIGAMPSTVTGRLGNIVDTVSNGCGGGTISVRGYGRAVR